MQWAAVVATTLGVLWFLLGVWRFAMRTHFGGYDALRCLLALVPAALLLLVFDYVLHHAPLVTIMLLVIAAALHSASPVWDVALGAVLVAAVAGPAIKEWREEKSGAKAQDQPATTALEESGRSEEGK